MPKLEIVTPDVDHVVNFVSGQIGTKFKKMSWLQKESLNWRENSKTFHKCNYLDVECHIAVNPGANGEKWVPETAKLARSYTRETCITQNLLQLLDLA